VYFYIWGQRTCYFIRLSVRRELMMGDDCYLRATALIGFQDLVEEAGGDAYALLTEAGINPKTLANPDSVLSYARHANLFSSFSHILETVRENMARNFLAESEAPIARIAGLLDYSTTAPFSLAFKRWTGKTPLEFRKDERLPNQGRLLHT
jgi:AraC-like DNA-binding protein